MNVHAIYLMKQNFENNMKILLVDNEVISHYVYIKDFNRFAYNETKHKNIFFYIDSLRCFSNKNINKPSRSLFRNKWGTSQQNVWKK